MVFYGTFQFSGPFSVGKLRKFYFYSVFVSTHFISLRIILENIFLKSRQVLTEVRICRFTFHRCSQNRLQIDISQNGCASNYERVVEKIKYEYNWLPMNTESKMSKTIPAHDLIRRDGESEERIDH